MGAIAVCGLAIDSSIVKLSYMLQKCFVLRLVLSTYIHMFFLHNFPRLNA